jgi:hypothetical protein
MRLLRQLEAEDASKASEAVRQVHAAVSKQQLLLLLQQQQQQQQLQAEAGAAAEVEEDASSSEDDDDAYDPWGDRWERDQEEGRRWAKKADLTAAVQVADALLPDWLGTQLQRPQELRDAVLAAVQRVGAAAYF